VKTKQKRFGHTKILCLVLSLLMMVSVMPMGATFASAEDGDEVSSEIIQTEESVEPTESTEPEESEPDEAPEESGEPENTTYANSISGVLWIDANEDGIYDSGEQPLANYPVYLYVESDTDNAVDTATTDADGKYLFEDISPGRYVVGIKAEENGTEYLLPLVGVQNNNKFYFTPDYSKVISNPIDIVEDSVVEDISAAMRNRPGIQSMAAYTIDISSPAASGTGWAFASGVLTFNTTANSNTYTITGTTTTNRIVVPTGVTTSITLSDASITNSSVSPFQLNGSANVTLTLTGTNTISCTYTLRQTGIRSGIYVPSGTSLTIGGTGSLQAVGGYNNAGIGGGYTGTIAGQYAGNITINSGNITASGGGLSAGIGAASSGSAGTIIINGGTVTATSSATGPGIGCVGDVGAGSGGTVTITGGTVTATGGTYSASLGGDGIGNDGEGGFAVLSSVTISGGRVTARSGSSSTQGIRAYDIVFTGGSIYPTNSAGTVSVYPTPTNGSTYGAPDTVTMRTISSATSGKTAGQAYAIQATGTKSTYTYNMLVHPDGNAYPWVPSYTSLVPTATTNAATSVMATGATLNGTFNVKGLSGTVSFQYGTSSTLASYTTVGSATSTASGSTSKTYSLTGLTPGTTYYYRIAVSATDGGPAVNGAIVSFTTPTPAATTTAATSVTGISASLNGTYNTAGVSGTVQFEYGTSSTLATYTTVNATTLTSSAATARSYTLSGLTPATTYYYRMVVIVNSVRYVGGIVSFTTLTPAATTTAATNVTGISASLNGTYNTQGYASTVQFEYGTSSTLATYTTANATTLTSSSATSRTFSLTGLTPATTYYYRLVIVVGTTRYTGSIVDFTTSTPTVVTSAADTVTSSSAVLNGAYNTQGYSGTVQFEYGTSSTLTTYTTVDNASVTVSTSTNKTYTLTGLTDTTTYYYRIVTVVNGVRYEGTIQSFTTPAPNYTVTKIFVDESSASFQANGTATVPIGTPIYNSAITTVPVSVTPDIYIYQGYKVGSYTAGDTLDGIGVMPTNMTLTGDTTIYFVYHKLDTTTISVTFSTDPMEFYVDGNTWPNVATGPYGSSNYYYSLTNASECAVQVGFKKMTIVTNDGLNFVADASSSLPGSHDISIDLNVATSAEIGTAVNAFTAGVSNIIPDTVYSTPVILGTLDGQYTHPSSGPVSTDGHITIGGYFADYLTGAGKYPTLKFTFEYTLITN